MYASAKSRLICNGLPIVVDALRHCQLVYIFGVGSSGITALDMKHKLMHVLVLRGVR